MNFIFGIQNHSFEKGTPWVELDKIKQRSWFLSVDIEDNEAVPCYNTEHELRISQGIAFKSVKILTGKTQETHPYWEALLDMAYLYSTELRDVTFKDLPGANGIYMLNIWFDYDSEDLKFGNNFKKLCEYRHKWDDGWICSKCGVRKADWIEADIKTTTREYILKGRKMGYIHATEENFSKGRIKDATVPYYGLIFEDDVTDESLKK